MSGCQGCQERAAEHARVTVTVKRPPTTLFFVGMGIVVGWCARGALID